MSSSELSRRAQKILHAVVTEYLHAGEAVGSRTVTRRHDLKLSPATVRNVMADLEELGLLEQRHSSAGRMSQAAFERRSTQAAQPNRPHDRINRSSPPSERRRDSQLLLPLSSVGVGSERGTERR